FFSYSLYRSNHFYDYYGIEEENYKSLNKQSKSK
ncbi:unnamed protein product, partial [marine sediment metagenome]